MEPFKEEIQGHSSAEINWTKIVHHGLVSHHQMLVQAAATAAPMVGAS